MSFADYVKKRRSGEVSASKEVSAPKKEEQKPVETETGFAEYVKKRRTGEIKPSTYVPPVAGFDYAQGARRKQTNNIHAAAVEAYNAGKVDLSKIRPREGLNPNQTIGNASGVFTPATPEPANLTREGQWAAKHPIAGTGMYAVANLVGGGEGVANAIDAAVRSATGKGKLKASEIKSAPLANAYRTGVSEGVRNYVETSDENLPKVLRTVGNIKQGDGQYSSGEQALDFLTGVGTDAASSALGMAMGGNMSTYLMGANAANQSLYDTANDEKTTSGQALALAAANGIAEAFFEKFSVENAGAVQEMFRRNPVSVKDFARTLLVSAGVEGSEEMNTEIANILSDIFIRGENSESGRMYARAIENGAEPNAAAAEVLRANLKQIGMAGLGGALSGGLHTGLYSSVGTMQRGMDLHNMTSAADIMDTIDTSTKEGQTAYDIASKIAEKEASGKRATAIDYGRLQNAIDNAVEAASVPSTEETVPTTENAAPTIEETAPTTDDVEIREVPRGDFRSSDAIRQTAENVRAQMDADYQEAFNEMYGADTEGIRNRGGNIEGTKENKRSYHIPVETLVKIDEDNRNNKTYSGLGRYGQETFDTQSFGRDAYDSATSLYNSIRFGQDLTEAEKMRNARLLTDDQVFNISQAAFKDLNSFYNWDRAGKISAMAEKHTLKDVTPGKVTYADGIDIDAIRADGSKEARQKVAQMAYAEGLLSKVFGYNVHWIQSGIDDNTGRYVGENGSYDPSTHTISLDINAGANYVGDAVKYGTVISHELTHTLELGAVEQYKKIADSVMNILVNDEEYSHGRNAQQIIADMIENNPHVHNESEAVHELVAQACEDMLNGNRDVQEMLAGLDEAEQKSFFDRISDIFNSILQFIEDMLSSDAVKSDRREAEALRRAKDEIEGLQAVWNEGVKNAAVANGLESAFGDETGNIIRDENGEAVIAESEDGKSMVCSIRTLPVTQQKLAEVLKEKGYSAESIKAAQDQVQDLADMMTRVSVYYAEMAEALDAELLVDPKTGKTVLHSFVTNGDYPINIDFLTVCKKREAYMRVLADLIEHGVFDKVAFNGAAIATTNEILRDSGFETACACCFVESRRLQIQRWAETFCSEWNEEVLKRNPNATPFNFSKGERGANDLTQDEIIQLENELRSVTKKEKNPKGNIKLPGKGARANMGPLLDRIPSLAHTLSVGDLITPNGIDSLRTLDGNLFSLVKQRYGTATPKITQSFSPYSGDVADLSYGFMRTEIKESVPGSKKYKADAKRELIKEGIKKPTAKQIEDRALRKYLYDIGGVRLQSFSDFLIENTLDYFQMFADLAAKGLPLHAYSKEISFIKIFGMTGGKMNMSLIPVVDLATDKEHAGLKKNKDGTYSYAGWGDYEHHLMIDNRSFIQSIGFKDAIALQLHPGYSSHIGTIAIGISNAHIRKMLNDPLIRMVIPYHSSGMLPEFAKQMHIDYYHDYTTTQNTTLGRCTDMSGNEVETYNLKGNDSYKCDTHYDFNEAFQRLGDARGACEEYKAWCKERHPVYKGSKQVGWAEFTPKFAEFADEPNYYKLIEDFNSYDCITEAPAIQGAVTMSFPGAEENLLDEEQLKAYEERLRATGQFSEKEIQKYVSRANESLEEIITREAKNRNAYHREMDKKYDATLAKIEGKLQKDYNKSDYELVNNKYERKQYSTRGNVTSRNSEGAELTKAQQEYFKDSKVRDEDGNLLVVYHGTYEDFNVFDSSKGRSNMDIQGSFFSPWDIDAEGYGPNVKTVYLNIKNPAPEDIAYKALNMFKGQNGAGQKARDYLIRQGYDGVNNSNEEYIAFYPEQIKNIDNQNPTENEDIRYSTRDNTINGYTPSSIGSIEELMRYNSGIRDMSAGLAAALEEKGAQGAKLSDAQVEKIARKFIKQYGSEADPKKIAGGLKSMFDYIDMTSKVSASQLGKIAHDYAKEILEKATEENRFGNQYPELKKGFKTANLKLTEELKGDIINTYGSVPNFKRQMRGILDISEKGTQGVDTYYEELKGLHPDLFTDDIINPADQLEKIAEVAELINQKRVKSDFGPELDENAYVLGQEMVAQYFAEKGDSRYKREVDEIKAEMTKKHQAEMAELRADAAKEYQKLKDRLGSKAMKVANVRAELNAMHRRVMERRELRLLTKEAKIRLMKQAKALWKLKGSAEFESAKRDLIGNLDLVSFGMSDGTRLNLEKIRKDALTQAAQDPDYAMSAEFADAQKLYERLNKQRISDMSLEQIESLTKAVLALKNSQQTYNRMLKEELGDYVADYGIRLITQQQLISGIRGKSHMMNALKRYALYMENPTRAAHLLDGYQQNGVFTELFDDINEGAIRAESFRQRADEMFRPVLEDKELTRTWSKQNIPIKVGSDTYYISKGMRIAIYLHSLNNDNMRHIKKGGFTIPDEKLYRQGRYTEAYAAGKRVPMSEGTVREIISEMTPAERKFAGVAKEFFNSVTKDAINEVSLQLKGFELAMVNNYMPIRTNPNFTQREIEGLVRDGTIEGAGQFKDRVPGASNPILLEDIAQVIKRQTDTTAQYYGLAIPVRNANKVWNFTSYRFNNSVKDAVAKNWLTDGAKIFENVLTDIQAGARRGDTGSHLFSAAKGAYAAAVLTANVGVSIKQSASYPLAIHMLDAASLAKGIVGKVDREYMDSITPLSWARRHGMGGQVEVADVFRQKGMIDDNPMVQKMKDLTNWIQAVDVATTDHLFVACEEYVKAHNPGLEVRGDEYNKMVADLYNSVLQRTQPSYGVMQRNELMRSSDAIMKALTMFKTQTFNMGGELLDAGLRVQALSEMQKKGWVTKEEVNGAKRNMANVVGATILSQAMLAILATMANAILHKMKPYRDDEGNVTIGSVAAKTARDFGSSFFGLFFGLDVASQMASAVTGGKWYDVTAPQLDGINEAISATSKWSEALSKYMNGSGTKTDLIKQSGNMAIKISGAFGIPANNVYNIANAVNLWVQDVQTGKVGTFESGYGILGITDTSLTAKQYKDRLYSAVDQYGYGTKEYEKAMDELKRKTGKEEKEIFGSPYDDLYQVYREHGENSQEFKNRVKFLEEIGKKPKDIAKALNNRGATVTIK